MGEKNSTDTVRPGNKNLSRRDLFNFLLGLSAGSAIKTVGDLIPEVGYMFSDSLLNRERAEEIVGIESVSYSKAFEKMVGLCGENNVKIGMRDGEILLNSPFSSEVSLGNKDGPDWHREIQLHAKLCYATKAREKSGELTFEDYYLEKYLPEAIKILGRNNVSLDTYVAWMVSAQAVIMQEREDQDFSEGYNSDANEVYLQRMLSVLKIGEQGMLGSTPLSDWIRTSNFADNRVQSAYDAPRMYVVTELMSDLEWERMVDGWSQLDDVSRLQIETEYPSVSDSLKIFNNARRQTQQQGLLLMEQVDSYLNALDEGAMISVMLRDENSEYWQAIGWGDDSDSRLRNYLSTNFNPVWAKTVIELKSSVDDMTQSEAAALAMGSVKNDLIDLYQVDKEEAKKSLLHMLLDYPIFVGKLRCEAKNSKWETEAEELDFRNEIFRQQVNYMRRDKAALAKSVHATEFDEKLQLKLFLGVVSESVKRVKSHKDEYLDLLMSEPAGEMMASLWYREVGPMQMLSRWDSPEYRHSLFGMSYEPEGIYDVMKVLARKVHESGKPYQAIDFADYMYLAIKELFKREIVYSREKERNYEPEPLVEFMNTSEWLQDPQLKQVLERVGKIKYDLGMSILYSYLNRERLYGKRAMIVRFVDE